MKKLFLVLLAILLMGGAGFAAGWFLLRPPNPAEAGTGAAEHRRRGVLYKMPLGKFTFQVLQPARILHIVIDLDVFIDDATAFERLNGAAGRARLRDSTLAAASDMAETMLWVRKGREDELDTAAMAARIALQLHSDFPSVRSAQINEFMASNMPRQ